MDIAFCCTAHHNMRCNHTYMPERKSLWHMTRNYHSRVVSSNEFFIIPGNNEIHIQGADDKLGQTF